MVSGAVRHRVVLLPRWCVVEPPQQTRRPSSTSLWSQLPFPKQQHVPQWGGIAGLRCFQSAARPWSNLAAPGSPGAGASSTTAQFGLGSLRQGQKVTQGILQKYGGSIGSFSSPISILRQFSSSRRALQETSRSSSKTPATLTATSTSQPTTAAATRQTEATTNELAEKQKATDSHLDKHGFAKSEKANKAAHVNLRAKLSKDGMGGGKSGFAEVWRLIKIAKPEIRWLLVAFAFLLVSSAVTMTIPMSIGKILDLATKDPTEDARLLGLTQNQFFIAFGCVLTIGAIANFSRVVLLRIIGERVVARLRSQLYRRTYIQDAEFFDANRVGDLISRLSSDTIIVGKGITQNLSDGLRAIVSGTGGFVAMFWISPQLCGILLFMLPPVATAAFFYGRAIRNISRKIQKSLGNLTKIAEERLGNVKTSQAFAGELQEVARYNAQIKRIFALGKRESLIAATFFGSTGWAGNMTILALLVSGGGLVKSGAISLGDLTSFMMYTAFAGGSLFGVSGFYSELMRSAGAASRLFELQDRNPTIPATVGLKVKSAQGPIAFKNVTFAYPTRPAVNIFKGLDFTIPSGSNVCIVGPSGGGKSTVAGLILRFYNPTSGQITVNDVDIADMNVKSLRRRIGLVSQEPVLFSGTIAENISYGKPKATRAEVIAAAQKANCQFISDFPEGLETQVGARGAQLSGGQKQRIAIARALLKDPDILILDEATSALDAESETLVNGAMAALMKGRSTTISIAHRLSTIKRSDRIVVLSGDGKVAEVGTYKELSQDEGSSFTRLMEWQMHGSEVGVKESSAGGGNRGVWHGSRGEEHVTEREEIEEDLESGYRDEDMDEDEDDEEVGEGRRKRADDGGKAGGSERKAAESPAEVEQKK
ncbi:putative atp-dependent permease mdl2 protein [Zalerion maritima]|uniref:Atp-dependent permease mdl2 protein n=1 Tax=Zalerion maritima TaxID=339359 RepID=A0AAD5RIH9_9PEZI|nr:putative atp-dependent permease mdl2 protein [Zalerion maritima]